MKTPMLWMVALGSLSGTALAQDLTGTWQGTLQPAPGRELRTVIKISKADGGALRGVMYSIDQGGQPTPVNPVTLQGATVKMTIPALAGTYEGKLDADGIILTGNWTQQGAPNPLPLVLRHVTNEAAWAIPEPPPPPKPMAADATPSFEVATIKPSRPEAQGKAFRINGRQFSTINTSLSDLVTFAYGIHARQIANGPAWLETEKYDITAKPDGVGQPSGTQWRMMLQKLLAERFKLTFHRDKKELSVYTIVLGKNGHKLTRSEGDPNGLPSLFFRGLGTLPARNANMADFAGVMQSAVLDKPVLDQTGLTGRFDFILTWTPDEFQFGGLGVRPPAAAGNATAPDLFTAFQEQLGLKLESTKAPAEVFVVDRVEKHSEN